MPALPFGAPWLVAGVLLIAIVVLLWLTSRAGVKADAGTPAQGTAGASQRPSPVGKASSLAEVVTRPDMDTSEFLAAFVIDTDGKRRGETVDIGGEGVVLKHEGKFFLVPPDQVLIKDGQLIADPEIDWENAEHAGEQWRERSHDEMKYDDKGMPVVEE